jgi:hypothetical protein
VIAVTARVATEVIEATDVLIVGIEGTVMAAEAYTSAESIMLKAMAPEIVAGFIVEQCAAAALTGGNGSKIASTK